MKSLANVERIIQEQCKCLGGFQSLLSTMLAHQNAYWTTYNSPDSIWLFFVNYNHHFPTLELSSCVPECKPQHPSFFDCKWNIIHSDGKNKNGSEEGLIRDIVKEWSCEALHLKRMYPESRLINMDIAVPTPVSFNLMVSRYSDLWPSWFQDRCPDTDQNL